MGLVGEPRPQGSLRERFDTIVLPQQKPEDLLNGNPEKNQYKEPYPPEYVGGLGQLGVDALREFAEAGGTLVAIDSACEVAIKQLYLPVRNVVEGLPEEVLREVLAFAEFVSFREDHEEWRRFGREQFAKCYGPDEPE